MASEDRHAKFEEMLDACGFVAIQVSSPPIDVLLIDDSSVRHCSAPVAALKLRYEVFSTVRIVAQACVAADGEYTIVGPIAPMRLAAVLTLAAANARAEREARRRISTLSERRYASG